MEVAPGALLIAPPDAGPRASHVLCVFDRDSADEGAFYAVVLNEPTERPARPLAFYLPVAETDTAWWGGPTSEVFALVELTPEAVAGHRELPEARGRRPFVTDRTAVFFPFRDHPPEPGEVCRVRVFLGSIWLSQEQAALYRDEATIRGASDDVLFDPDYVSLAERLRHQETLRSKVEKSERARLVEPRKDAPTTVTFRPNTGRRPRPHNTD